MNKKALHTLEFDKITEKLAGYAASDMAKKKALDLMPSTDIEEITLWQKETSQAVSMIMKKGSLGFGGLRDITAYLKITSVGGTLSPGDLICIGDFLNVTQRVKSYSQDEESDNGFDVLHSQFDMLEIAENLKREIGRCIISDTEIADDASVGLRKIRRSISSANDKIKEQLNSIIHSQNYKNMLQEPVITIRNDRYCVPVKSEYKNSFTGMIHDQSSTGATFFIEPMSVVQLNNKIKDLHGEEKIEIEKILKNLSGLVFENADILKTDLEILSYLDFVFAKAELSVSMNASEPVFNTNGYINIKKARHPLLNKEEVVATDIYLGDKFTTGPNTGGKTVSLKTLGLFTLMGQAGLHISAFDNSQLNIFDDVFSDIGDEQSIEQSLSTFSSHMSNIVKILNNVTDNSLVLLDELGAGTDPTEGAALAVSIIEYLHKRKIRTAITTHYSELKVYAITTEGVENASCEFDVETLRPTYRLLIGIPGKSNAFAISKRLGLPDFIIENAREVLSREDKRFEDVITDLEISQKALIIEQERAQEYRLEAERLKSDVENQKRKTKQQRDKILENAAEQARRILSDAKDEADEIIKGMNKMMRENSSLKELDEKRQQLSKKLNKADERLSKLKSKKTEKRLKASSKKLSKGDRVFVESLNQSGELVSEPNSKGEVMIKIGIMNVKADIKDLYVDTSAQKPEENKKIVPKRYSLGVKSGKAQNIKAELDLRGCMVLEALEKVDKYIDDAYLAGLSPITIIHGKGTGALRSAIHDYLRNNSGVKSFRLGEYGEGEAGVTIVELK